MSDEPMTLSFTLRLRRVVYEDAFVAVPVTPVTIKQNEDGTTTIDSEALFAEAIRISGDRRIEWKLESTHTEIHPLLIPTPEDRFAFDPYYATELCTAPEMNPDSTDFVKGWFWKTDSQVVVLDANGRYVLGYHVAEQRVLSDDELPKNGFALSNDLPRDH
jgi:hypothetical protein